MELSKRMQAVTDMVTAGNTAADVGCDHGYVSIALIRQQICPHVIAMDINEGPLERAAAHIEQYGMTDYIETRLSDGVSALKAGEADTLICAGMGGRLILHILEQGREVTSLMKEWILQPQSEIALVRAYIRKQGYTICDERMICEEGKYYPVIKVCLTDLIPLSNRLPVMDQIPFSDRIPEENADNIADKFGPILLQKKDAVLYEYLIWQQAKYETILETLRHEEAENGGNARKQERIGQIEEELRSIRTAQGGFYEMQ